MLKQHASMQYVKPNSEEVEEFFKYLLRAVGRYEGIIYGGYVRNTITKADKCVDNIDVWFKNYSERLRFVRSMKCEQDTYQVMEVEPMSYWHRAFNILSLLITKNENKVVHVNLVYNNNLPVLDLAVNTLVCTYIGGTHEFYPSLPDVARDAETLTTSLLPSAESILKCKEETYRILGIDVNCQFFRERIRYFIRNGWTIIDSKGRTVTYESKSVNDLVRTKSEKPSVNPFVDTKKIEEPSGGTPYWYWEEKEVEKSSSDLFPTIKKVEKPSDDTPYWEEKVEKPSSYLFPKPGIKEKEVAVEINNSRVSVKVFRHPGVVITTNESTVTITL